MEQSLSVDNLFVFVVLFEYFKVNAMYNQRSAAAPTPQHTS